MGVRVWEVEPRLDKNELNKDVSADWLCLVGPASVQGVYVCSIRKMCHKD